MYKKPKIILVSASLLLRAVSVGDNCNITGIVNTSLEFSKDVEWSLNNNVLRLGKIGDSTWSASCEIYTQVATLNVQNLALVTDFKLIQAGFDDFIKISVNDNVAYVGPYGGTTMDLIYDDQSAGAVGGNSDKDQACRVDQFISASGSEKPNAVSIGDDYHCACELNTNWSQNLDLDLKDYLQEGDNEIKMEVVVDGTGEGWAKFAEVSNPQCTLMAKNKYVDTFAGNQTINSSSDDADLPEGIEVTGSDVVIDNSSAITLKSKADGINIKPNAKLTTASQAGGGAYKSNPVNLFGKVNVSSGGHFVCTWKYCCNRPRFGRGWSAGLSCHWRWEARQYSGFRKQRN